MRDKCGTTACEGNKHQSCFRELGKWKCSCWLPAGNAESGTKADKAKASDLKAEVKKWKDQCQIAQHSLKQTLEVIESRGGSHPMDTGRWRIAAGLKP